MPNQHTKQNFCDEVMMRLEQAPASAGQLSVALGTQGRRVSRCLQRLRRLGVVVLENRIWRLAERWK